MHVIICADIHIYVCASESTYTNKLTHSHAKAHKFRHTCRHKKIPKTSHHYQHKKLTILTVFLTTFTLSDEYIKHETKGHRHCHVTTHTHIYIYIYICVCVDDYRDIYTSFPLYGWILWRRSNRVAISVYFKLLRIWIEVSVAIERMYVNNCNCDS